ncbi:MAG: ABC transporter permease, partial [Chloroflexi bacterium]|nr:ABC transporter permease [Chloroflexota bacterium]
RAFFHQTSYRLAFALNVVNMLVGVISFVYLSRLIEAGDTHLLAEYGNNAAAFIIVGTTFNSFVGLALRSFSGSINSEQFLGVLEQWLMARVGLTRLVIYSTFYEFLWPTVLAVLTFTMLALVFAVPFSPNLPAVLAAFVLTIASVSGLGLISAGVVLVAKQGDPIAFTWGVLAGLLSGVYYPLEVLPEWLRVIGYALPTTYGLQALRRTLINGAGLGEVSMELAILAAFGLATVPLGLWAFHAGFNRARREGTLSQY